MFGLNRFFGVRAPYEQVASDIGGGAGDPNTGAAGGDPNADPGTGSPAGGAPAGDPGTSQNQPTLSDEDRRRLEAYSRIEQEFGGNVPTKAELDRLRNALRAATGDAPAGAPPDPRTERLKSTILNLFPELKDALDLAKRRGDIEGILERRPEYDAGAQAHWHRQAQATHDELTNTFASSMLGAGKTGADLSPEQRKGLVEEFAGWLRGDQKRVERYESGEKGLVTEFFTSKRALWAPIQREAVAGSVARMPNAPAEGPSGGAPAGNRPAGAGAPPQNQDDRLEAAIDRAFDVVTQAGR